MSKNSPQPNPEPDTGAASNPQQDPNAIARKIVGSALIWVAVFVVIAVAASVGFRKIAQPTNGLGWDGPQTIRD